MAKGDIYDGHDPRELPLYTAREAALLTRLPESTVRTWAYGTERFRAVLDLKAKGPRALSFMNLVELHVLASLRREHAVEMGLVRKGIARLRRELGEPRPLLSKKLLADKSQRLFVEVLGSVIDVDGQVQLKEVVRQHLERIEYDDRGLPIRFFPFASNASSEACLVAVDPGVQFGKPTLAGRGVTTAVIAERFAAGDDIDVLAHDYSCSKAEIQAGLRFHTSAA